MRRGIPPLITSRRSRRCSAFNPGSCCIPRWAKILSRFCQRETVAGIEKPPSDGRRSNLYQRLATARSKNRLQRPMLRSSKCRPYLGCSACAPGRRRRGLKIPRRKAHRFDTGSGHHYAVSVRFRLRHQCPMGAAPITLRKKYVAASEASPVLDWGLEF